MEPFLVTYVAEVWSTMESYQCVDCRWLDNRCLVGWALFETGIFSGRDRKRNSVGLKKCDRTRVKESAA